MPESGKGEFSSFVDLKVLATPLVVSLFVPTFKPGADCDPNFMNKPNLHLENYTKSMQS